MELEDARAQLGVDSTTDARALRRAYLRALKLHPPERDPEGFRRVRDAFEVLSSEVSTRTISAEVVDAPPSTSEDSSVPDAVVVAPAPPAWADQERHQSIVHQLAQAPAAARLMRLEQELAATPDDAQVRLWLIDELCAQGRPEDAVRIARAGAAQGQLAFLTEVARIASHQLTNEELTTLAEAGYPFVFVELLRRQRADDAAAMAQRAVDAISTHEEAPADAALTYVYGLCAKGRLEESKLLLGRIRDALARSGTGSRLSERGKLKLLFATDLVEVMSEVPSEVGEPIAFALFYENPTYARPDLHAFRKRAAKEATQLARLLRDRAPALAGVFGDWIDPASLKTVIPWGSVLFIGLLLVGFMMPQCSQLLRSMRSGSRSEPPAVSIDEADIASKPVEHR